MWFTSLLTSYAMEAIVRDGGVPGVQRRRCRTDEARLAILSEVAQPDQAGMNAVEDLAHRRTSSPAARRRATASWKASGRRPTSVWRPAGDGIGSSAGLGGTILRCGRMAARIGDGRAPVVEPGVEVVQVPEAAGEEEVLADMAIRSLVVGLTRPRCGLGPFSCLSSWPDAGGRREEARRNGSGAPPARNCR